MPPWMFNWALYFVLVVKLCLLWIVHTDSIISTFMGTLEHLMHSQCLLSTCPLTSLTTACINLLISSCLRVWWKYMTLHFMNRWASKNHGSFDMKVDCCINLLMKYLSNWIIQPHKHIHLLWLFTGYLACIMEVLDPPKEMKKPDFKGKRSKAKFSRNLDSCKNTKNSAMA